MSVQPRIRKTRLTWFNTAPIKLSTQQTCEFSFIQKKNNSGWHSFRLTVDDDIDAIIHQGEECTAEFNSKYKGLGFNVTSFDSKSIVQWEGEERDKWCIVSVHCYLITCSNQNLFIFIATGPKHEPYVSVFGTRTEGELFSRRILQGDNARSGSSHAQQSTPYTLRTEAT